MELPRPTLSGIFLTYTLSGISIGYTFAGIDPYMLEKTMNQVISTPDQLSHVLRSVRKARSLSQLEAGKTVGLLQKSVSALENHPESATLESLFKLLSALELELIVSPKKPGSGRDPATSDSGEW